MIFILRDLEEERGDHFVSLAVACGKWQRALLRLQAPLFP